MANEIKLEIIFKLTNASKVSIIIHNDGVKTSKKKIQVFLVLKDKTKWSS